MAESPQLQANRIIPIGYYKSISIEYNGKRLKLYSISWLSGICGKRRNTFIMLEKRGRLPKPLFDVKDGFRWYCAAEVNGYAALYRKARMVKGKVAAGMPRRGDWFQENAFRFRDRLRELMKTRTKMLPEKLAQDDGKPKYGVMRPMTFSPEELQALVTGK